MTSADLSMAELRALHRVVASAAIPSPKALQGLWCHYPEAPDPGWRIESHQTELGVWLGSNERLSMMRS
ncbi:hypothetical protein LDENG_00057530 [Lucifuga dentata]|nr:hypothetical protein LDENG_00057530 [Lucifuga dentata]